MHSYRADLHVHTVLSPCAQVEMIPPLIVSAALARGIALIAITDHNASANIAAVQKAAARSDLVVLPGVEVQTREEVHLLCLFDTLEQSAAYQAVIDAALPDRLNDPDFFGEQYVVDETGDFIRQDDRLLLTSTALSLEQAVQEAQALGGLAIPAHIDRQAFGLIAVLGFVPPGLPVDALEITRRLSPEAACERFPQVRGYPLIQGADAHHPSELLGAIRLMIEAPTVDEIRLALKEQSGRFVKVTG